MSLKNILVVPGSLRANSSTHHIIRFLVNNSPANINLSVFDGTGSLPHFNDEDTPPESVKAWRNQVRYASAILFVTPEYAFGVPGTLKNALDWLVGSGDISGKPTGLITAATGGEHAHNSLRSTLKALNAFTAENRLLLIPFIRSKMDNDGNVTDQASIDSLKQILGALADAIN